jgi:hypothetical protein
VWEDGGLPFLCFLFDPTVDILTLQCSLSSTTEQVGSVLLNCMIWCSRGPSMTAILQQFRFYALIWTYITYFFSGTAAECGLWLPRSRGLVITHNDAPQSVGILWMSDQLSQRPLPDNTQHIKQTSMPPGGIRTHDRSSRSALERAVTGTGNKT